VQNLELMLGLKPRAAAERAPEAALA